MAYTKQTWTDLAGTGLNKYTVTDSGSKKALVWDPDSVTENGTPVTAERMNHIEDGVKSNSDNIGNPSSLSTTNKNNLVEAVNELNTKKAEQSVVNSKASIAISTTVTLASASWVADGTLFTQSVSLSGLLSTDVPFCQGVCDDETDMEAWGMIIKADATAGTLTFTAIDTPTVDLDVVVVVIR